MKHQTFTCLCVLALTIIVCSNVSNAAEDLSKTCGQVVSKVIPCLDFATGKAPTPKKECCDAAKSIKDTDPECLCYIIQQTHKGSPESKSMGIQEDKLLQLPGVCGVKANISDCPKLLGLSPSSPDAAIFKNVSKINPPSSAASSTGTPATPTPSGSHKLRPVMMGEVMMATLAFVLAAVPTGLISIKL
ncbi:non-specific lipid transfer protein GPI-anchored 1-like [Vicia villosa]|uniref:non-specific lipid transfer protein GPI-anchored 1-like n=1 Tax=Vicia villosa TaxID=3911 RepID=UPI00273C479A|nr:non-specific lipid transfer protein GPI-anchored 1-like [Vicia villosa]